MNNSGWENERNEKQVYICAYQPRDQKVSVI